MVKHRKLLFSINSLNGGGAERVISNLANFFCVSGYEVLIVCLNEAKPAYALETGIKVYSLIGRQRGTGLFYRLFYAAKTFTGLLRLLRKERPACVISFMTSANLWSGLTCSLLNIPYLVSERITPDYTVNQFNHFLRWVSAVVYGKSKAIVVPSKGMIGGFKKKSSFGGLNNFQVINNPVNQFKLRTQGRVHERNFVLGVGRLDRQKGFDLLIPAFKLLEREDLDLLISGEGTEREDLQDQIRSLQLEDRVKLIGHQKNLQDYYTQAELFVLSSRNEGYPNVLVEAMSLGCACVATDCEFGPADIVADGENGLLIEPYSINALYVAMKRIIDDPALKIKLSKNARMINQTNSAENTYARWEQLVLNHI